MSYLRSFFLLSFSFFILVTSNIDNHYIFKQHHSFQQPLLIVDSGIAFWDLNDGAVVSDDSIILTPEEKGKKGSIWNTWSYPFLDWEVVFEFSIGGSGKKGADGMAFWYTNDRMNSGEVFGSKDNWRGLGIFFDSYDNDNKRDNPSIYAIVNDGTKSFQHEKDGGDNILGKCQVDYRNRKNHVFTKIRYVDNVLELNYDVDGTGNWKNCFKVPSSLSKNYFFGFSAATGGLADQHALYSFSTFSFESDSDQIEDDENVNKYIKKTVSDDKKDQEVDEGKKLDILKELENLKVNDDFLEQIEERMQKDKVVEKAKVVLEQVEDEIESDENIQQLQTKLKDIESILTKHMFDVLKFQKLMTEALQTIMSSSDGSKSGSENSEEALKALKEEIAQTKNILNAGIVEKVGKVKRDVNSLTTQLETMKYSIDSLKNDISSVGRAITKDLETPDEPFITFGFISYFILFQIVFVVALIFWKKLRNDSKRKLY